MALSQLGEKIACWKWFWRLKSHWESQWEWLLSCFLTRAGICGELVGIRDVCMQLADQLQQAQVSASDQLRGVSQAAASTSGVVQPATASEESAVSFQSELPQPLQQAMVAFIERCPNWDQYRLVQAALAGFLIQHGVESREITRLYVGNMFRRESLTQGV